MDGKTCFPIVSSQFREFVRLTQALTTREAELSWKFHAKKKSVYCEKSARMCLKLWRSLVNQLFQSSTWSPWHLRAAWKLYGKSQWSSALKMQALIVQVWSSASKKVSPIDMLLLFFQSRSKILILYNWFGTMNNLILHLFQWRQGVLLSSW